MGPGGWGVNWRGIPGFTESGLEAVASDRNGPPPGWNDIEPWQEWPQWAKEHIAAEPERGEEDYVYRQQLELAVLGAVILEPALLPDTLARIGMEAFQDTRCRAIYDAVLSVDGELTLHSVMLHIAEGDRLESCGGPGFIGLTVEGAPADLDCAKKLAALSAREQHARNLRMAADQAQDGKPVDVDLLAAPATEAESVKTITLSALDSTDKKPIPWVVKNYLATGDKIVLAGEPGVGKSFVALDLAIALATGTKWIVMDTVQSRVLYCDEENGEGMIGQRLQMLTRGSYRGKIPDDRLCVTYQNGISFSNPAKWKSLLGIVDRFEPDFIVFDSLVRFHNLNENDNSEMARFFNQAIKPLPCGVIMLHHLNKPSNDRPGGANRIRGASDIVASYDGAWILERTAPGSLTLQQMKNRHVPEPPPLAIDFSENTETGFRITRGGF